MKYQALFSLKGLSKKLRCRLLHFFFFLGGGGGGGGRFKC